MDTENTEVFSLQALICPKCGSGEFKPIGFKGSASREIFSQLGLRTMAHTNEHGPLVCRCLQCGTKFTGRPRPAEPEELLESPCTISLTRSGGFIGALIDFPVFLNGVRAGSLGSGQTIEISTKVKHNVLFVASETGAAFSNFFRFDAVPGGTETLTFSR
ncbi:hypothetical protein [Breznakiella homolactica]|uniref:Uncharacterized protein n=1 Tax=Breznakiella homolactica TaxID=2798577 RepID=A0A7T7XM28_9SPIR|nr:hypothetical protein [Breznakiella homolactica]QQO08768.1 hypothetical protein JFL75_17845 [Breznakiella homolactica]